MHTPGEKKTRIKIKNPYRQYRTPPVGNISWRAGNGDDDPISQLQPQQQQQSMPGGHEVRGKWKQHVGSARIAWGKLTEDELLQSEGQAQ